MIARLTPRTVRMALIYAALVLGVGSAVTAGGRTVAFAVMVENWLIDLRIAVNASPGPQHDTVALVAIDEQTLAKYPYRHPIDRGLLAAILRRASEYGAKAIAFDILFDQMTESEKDDAFVAAVRESRIPVYIGYGDKDDGLTDEQSEFLSQYARHAKRAHVNLLRDDYDGTVRATLVERGTGLERRPGLAAALYRELTGEPVGFQPELLRFRRGETRDGPPFATYRARVFATGLLPASWIEGKVLLVGAVLPQEDRYPTSLVALDGIEKGTLPGVHIHAHALADLLEGSPLRRSPWIFDILLCTVFAALGTAAGSLSSGAAPRLMVIGKAASVALALAALAVVGTMSMRDGGLVAPLFSPTVALIIAGGAAAAITGRRHREERQFIRSAMSRYVPPAIVDELERQPDLLGREGSRREVTLIFSDIQGFTSVSERHDPEVVVSVLSDYLAGMTAIVMEEGGTLDKFIGDAVMVIFGAPVPQPDHAARAIACARRMDAFASDFMTKGLARSIGFGVTRIGVHSGDAVVGNIGGAQRVDYTAIGDTVNTAARLEGANKYLGTRVCISEETVSNAGIDSLRPIGNIVLKGRSKPLLVYELEDATEDYRKGFQQLLAGRLDVARGFFMAVVRRAQQPDADQMVLGDRPRAQALIERMEPFGDRSVDETGEIGMGATTIVLEEK